MDTNVKGVFFLTQKLLPLLRTGAKKEPSRVVNIGSIDGLSAGAFENYAYGPSKAALHHLTRILAATLIKEKIISQIKLNIKNYKKNEIPDDLNNIEPIKPGSKSLSK